MAPTTVTRQIITLGMVAMAEGNWAHDQGALRHHDDNDANDEIDSGNCRGDNHAEVLAVICLAEPASPLRARSKAIGTTIKRTSLPGTSSCQDLIKDCIAII